MNKKLLFFDIDGTLLCEKTHQIPQSTILAIQQAKANGHLIFINTGRPFSTIDSCIKNLQPDGYVCGCGTYISYQNTILYHFQVTQKRCHELIELLNQNQIFCIFEASDKVYFQKDLSDSRIYAFYRAYQQAHFPIGFFDDQDVHVDKFSIQFYHDITPFYQEINNDFDIIKRKKDFSEIIPKGHSKATGIQFLVDYFNSSLDNCYVFGDSFNDEAMLMYVPHAIVMKNGDPKLYEIAEYVTDDIECEGIEKALKHYHLI